MRRGALALAPETTRVDRHAVNVEHRCRSNRPHVDIVTSLIAVFEGYHIVRYNSGAPAIRAQAKNRFSVFFNNVFALVEFDEVLARSDHAWPLRDRKHRRALRRKRLGHGLVETFDDCDD